MNRTRSRHDVSACLALLGMLASSFSALARDITRARPGVAEVLLQDYWVEWRLPVPNDGFVLTVSGPDGVSTEEYGPGEQAFFTVLDPAGKLRADGLYKWELVLRDHGTKLLSANGAEEDVSFNVTQSGAFSILGGRILNAQNVTELPPLAVTTGDQVFQGRMCVGADCAALETWPAASINEIRMKFPNNRLSFIDTSAAAGGFPEGDWQIRLNSSDAGAANFFAVDWLGAAATLTSETPVSTPFKIEGSAPNNALYVDQKGNVGLGTSIPDKRVQIVGTATANAELHIGGAGDEAKDIFAGMGPNLNLGPAFNFGYAGFSFGRSSGFFNVRPDAGAAAPNPSLRFMTANQERMIITNLGAVGIGTSTPASKLEVQNGDIRVTGGSFIANGTTLNVPDYVFEPGYRLMPLAELAAFVAREKHLPDLPDAAEIRRNGLNLGEFQMRLLAKIEELTLHLINQNQRLAGLRRENRTLKEASYAEIENLRRANAELRSRLAAIEKLLGRH